MRILLINPPSPYLANDAAYPPMSLMYVATAFQRSGSDARIMDLTGNAKWDDDSVRWADAFGITCTTPNDSEVRKIIDKLPLDKYVLVGGVHPTFVPLNHPNPRVVRIMGEVEGIASRLVQDLGRNKMESEYQGGIAPAAMLGKPSRNLVDLRKYAPGGWPNSTVVYTSRGCPFECTFCSKIAGRVYRRFPLEQTLSEIRECMDLGFKRFVFGDDNMMIEPRKLAGLLTAIKDFGIEFRLNQDARAADKDILALAAEAGCIEVSYGIESGSQRILDNMNKNTTAIQNGKAIACTKEAGIRAKAYFIVNFPGETEVTVAETISWAERFRPDKWLLSSFAPLPGSKTYANPRDYGIEWLSENWDDYYLVGKDGTFKPCFETRYLTRDKQIELHEMMYSGLKKVIG